MAAKQLGDVVFDSNGILQTVGGTGIGSYIIDEGPQIDINTFGLDTSLFVTIGEEPGSQGTFTINGGSSSLRIFGSNEGDRTGFDIGAGGTGFLNVLGGGLSIRGSNATNVQPTGISVGSTASGIGVMTVRDAYFDMSGTNIEFSIGTDGGDGTVDISGSSRVYLNGD